MRAGDVISKLGGLVVFEIEEYDLEQRRLVLRHGAHSQPAPARRQLDAERGAHTARAPAPRAAGNGIGKDATAAIKSLLEANKARPPSSVHHAFASARDPNPLSASLLGASAVYAP